MKVALTLSALFSLMLISLSAFAQNAEEIQLQKYVDNNTQQLVAKLNRERGLYRNNPEKFYQSMEESLDDFVDFRRIAARVMGKYARQASAEQRDEFVEQFKRSLFDSYAQALVNSQQFTIEVKQAVINPGNNERAAVGMEIISASGSRYPVTYSMYKTDSGQWMMENVIVEGVNIGLAFRDRFSQEMEAKGGNLQAVIESWGANAVRSIQIENGPKG